MARTRDEKSYQISESDPTPQHILDPRQATTQTPTASASQASGAARDQGTGSGRGRDTFTTQFTIRSHKVCTRYKVPLLWSWSPPPQRPCPCPCPYPCAISIHIHIHIHAHIALSLNLDFLKGVIVLLPPWANHRPPYIVEKQTPR